MFKPRAQACGGPEVLACWGSVRMRGEVNTGPQCWGGKGGERGGSLAGRVGLTLLCHPKAAGFCFYYLFIFFPF